MLFHVPYAVFIFQSAVLVLFGFMQRLTKRIPIQVFTRCFFFILCLIYLPTYLPLHISFFHQSYFFSFSLIDEKPSVKWRWRILSFFWPADEKKRKLRMGLFGLVYFAIMIPAGLVVFFGQFFCRYDIIIPTYTYIQTLITWYLPICIT